MPTPKEIMFELQQRHDAGTATGEDRLNLDALELIQKLRAENEMLEKIIRSCKGYCRYKLHLKTCTKKDCPTCGKGKKPPESAEFKAWKNRDNLRAENAKLKARLEAVEKLCCCYRLQKSPPEKLLKALDRTRQALNE